MITITKQEFSELKIKFLTFQKFGRKTMLIKYDSLQTQKVVI